MAKSLWGDDFELPEIVPTKAKTKKILDTIDGAKEVKVEKAIKSKSVPIEEKIRLISENVHRILGKYEENTQVIRDKMTFVNYIDKAIENGIIAIDTETNNSLDPITCLLMGGCIYTPGQKNAYIPINHVDMHTGEKLPNQLTESDIKEQFDRLKETKIIMHNGKFDYKVIKCTCNCKLSVYWDTILAAKILNNTEHASLKEQYIAKIDSSIQKYDIEGLFEKMEYAIFPPELFALYAATDAFMTYKLYLWQKKEFEKPEYNRLFDIFFNVEMPILEVTAEMELYGVKVDKDYASILSKKYHDKKQEVEQKIQEELKNLDPMIEKWRLTPEANEHKPIMVNVKDANGNTKQVQKVDKKGVPQFSKSKSEQLDTPLNVASAMQLAILFYDIYGVPEVYNKKEGKMTRPTGEEEMKAMGFPICKLILESRGIDKLLSTYIDKIPDCVKEKTGRLHASFNQIGTDTGRYSSKDPNLQNIPSKEPSIRMMFVPSEGYAMVGCDYSQQEPRLMSSISGDEAMINAYRQGKDLYATIGTGVYGNDYWDNMEHHEDGSANPEGKHRRKKMKVVMLGISYGMGNGLLAERLGCTPKEAGNILEDFYKGFPTVKKWKDSVEAKAKQVGYVEDLWGRRRQLPDLFLPEYEIFSKDSPKSMFNPLLYTKGLVQAQKPPIVIEYEKKLANARGMREIDKIKVDASRDKVRIIDHTNHIATAERQCVNAVIQGSAATMTKKAMILAYHDKELNELGFHMLIPVHDELIGECPKENVERVCKRLEEVMISAPGNDVNVPFKCDGVTMNRWYEDEYLNELKDEYDSMIESGMTKDEALKKISVEKPESCIFDLEKEWGI